MYPCSGETPNQLTQQIHPIIDRLFTAVTSIRLYGIRRIYTCWPTAARIKEPVIGQARLRGIISIDRTPNISLTTWPYNVATIVL